MRYPEIKWMPGPGRCVGISARRRRVGDMVDARWLRWLDDVRRVAIDTVVAVTHAGVIRVALAGVAQSARFRAHWRLRIPFGWVHSLNLA